MNKGKEGARTTLAFEGMKRAVGYEYQETCEKPVRVKNKEGETVYVNHLYTYTKHQAGDPKLLIFMLECIDRYLKGDTWKQSQKLEIETKNLTQPQLVEAQSEQITQLAGKLQNFLNRKVVESKEI